MRTVLFLATALSLAACGRSEEAKKPVGLDVSKFDRRMPDPEEYRYDFRKGNFQVKIKASPALTRRLVSNLQIAERVGWNPDFVPAHSFCEATQSPTGWLMSCTSVGLVIGEYGFGTGMVYVHAGDLSTPDAVRLALR